MADKLDWLNPAGVSTAIGVRNRIDGDAGVVGDQPQPLAGCGHAHCVAAGRKVGSAG